MSAGVALPTRIFAHGLLLSRGEKMSKSVGNVIDPFAMANEFGVDQMRYFAMREVALGHDGNYTRESIINRINADLANDLGNLAQRSLSMIAKNCDGMVPLPGSFTTEDKVLLAATDTIIETAREAMELQAVNRYLDAVWDVVADANRYFAAEEPWERKTDPARMGTILYVAAGRATGRDRPAADTACGSPPARHAGAACGWACVLSAGPLSPRPAPRFLPTGAFPRYVDPVESAAPASAEGQGQGQGQEGDEG